MPVVVTCPKSVKHSSPSRRHSATRGGSGGSCLLLPGNMSVVRAHTPPSLSLHIERREYRSTLLNGAKGRARALAGPFLHLLIPAHH